MERIIRHQWYYPHPRERVWAYLTRRELLEQWLMPNDFEAVPGHRFQFTARPRIKLGFDGRISGEVLEVVPFEKLVYTWRGGSGSRISLDSVVTWTLRTRDAGTELQLEHKGFRGLKNLLPYLIMQKGWVRIGQRLGQRLSAPMPDSMP